VNESVVVFSLPKLERQKINLCYLIIILVSQCTEVVCTIITDVPQVFDLSLVTGLYPFHLLCTVVLDSVHLAHTNIMQLSELEPHVVLLCVFQHTEDYYFNF